MDNKSHRLWPFIGYTQFNYAFIIDYDTHFHINLDIIESKFANIPNDGRIIIIDQTSEHFSEHRPNNIEKLNYFLEKYDCKNRSVVFDNTHNEHYFKQYGVKHIAAPFYIYHFLAKTNPKIPTWHTKLDFNFVCLNNTHTPHRQLFVEALAQKNILQKTKWSYRQEIQSDYIDTPKFLDQQQENFNPLFNLQNLYQNALVALITETDFYDHNVTNVSEKTLFPIFYGCIPIVVGVPNSIKLLRDWGIDVYDDIIDHSYDTITDNHSRLSIIVDQCEKLFAERYPEKIRNLLAARVLRNQLLLSNKEYWVKQIRQIMYDYKY